MSPDPNTPSAIEQAVSRALRDNLERLQRTSDELHQAIGDVVAACASSKPANALPPMLRAQTSAASLSAALDVLSRFVTVSLQPGPKTAFEAEISRIAAAVQPAESAPAKHAQAPVAAEPKSSEPKGAAPAPAKPVAPPAPVEHHAPVPEVRVEAPAAAPVAPPEAPELESVPPAEGEPEGASAFDVNRLSAEEQELHRRANRVAKVSMQDIKMLRPEQVRLGRQHKDICVRLRDDIEKAHREYDRRFKPIMDHPVDYFYRWMVEILAEGDPNALGEYPYATTAQNR